MENGKDDSLPEAHLQSSVQKPVEALRPEVINFVKIFEFHLETQSFYRSQKTMKHHLAGKLTSEIDKRPLLRL
jgi:hypothetical protein